MEKGNFLIDKEGVWHPDQFDVFSTHLKTYSTKYPKILMVLSSLLVFTLLLIFLLLLILLLLLLRTLTISLSRSGCFSKVSLGSTHVCNYIHVFHMTFVIKVMIM